VTQYLYRPSELIQGIKPLDFMSCKRIELARSDTVHIANTGADEAAFVCVAGQFTYKIGPITGAGQFKDFLYVPWKSTLELSTPTRAVLVQVSAPSDRDTDFAHLKYSDVAKDPERHKVFGAMETSSLRDVYMYIDDKFKASRLLMGFTVGLTGGWTSWPPHEHAQDREELYVFFDMGRSFAIQSVYEDLETPLFCGIVQDGDLVAVPKGYHPNVGCPGGRITYFYAMAARVAGKREFMQLNIQSEFGDRLV
jgi:5-deoxy-glucuronate isomerase